MALSIARPSPQRRVPFGALLEAALLQPGQTLYFIRNSLPATILADGHIRCGELTGSIHAVAKSLSNGAPANGWDCWFFEDANGDRILIDGLRQQIRTQMDQGETR